MACSAQNKGWNHLIFKVRTLLQNIIGFSIGNIYPPKLEFAWSYAKVGQKCDLAACDTTILSCHDM